MKKFLSLRMVICLIVLLILCSACGNKTTINTYIKYENLPNNYTLESAKADGCVVFENHQLTSGEEKWQEFIERTEAGKAAMVRLAYLYLPDFKKTSIDYHDEIIDMLPLYIADLNFDGNTYVFTYTEDVQTYEYEYPYLVRFTGSPSSRTAIYSQYDRYFLVHDKDITFEEIERSWYSSQSGDSRDYVSVYVNLIN
ncbi:hypothetical protein EDC18_101443 [Natranaerovirga pectinivora]|uniref:Uncharacterized protein n=1 Tax=Natranaerovirga pectinivora TaxID=682400 RepID=A0A4R3MPD1_9FIRM|nr:hypothetical protein [Natranaerovirga pectinivora]TCT17145.1 hypothetical protein EDC18_101443 [Natranaerovirga pectinivora]